MLSSSKTALICYGGIIAGAAAPISRGYFSLFISNLAPSPIIMPFCYWNYSRFSSALEHECNEADSRGKPRRQIKRSCPSFEGGTKRSRPFTTCRCAEGSQGQMQSEGYEKCPAKGRQGEFSIRKCTPSCGTIDVIWPTIFSISVFTPLSIRFVISLRRQCASEKARQLNFAQY